MASRPVHPVFVLCHLLDSDGLLSISLKPPLRSNYCLGLVIMSSATIFNPDLDCLACFEAPVASLVKHCINAVTLPTVPCCAVLYMAVQSVQCTCPMVESTPLVSPLFLMRLSRVDLHLGVSALHSFRGSSGLSARRYILLPRPLSCSFHRQKTGPVSHLLCDLYCTSVI